jgi:hypothetical protein
MLFTHVRAGIFIVIRDEMAARDILPRCHFL